jgi:hypothetical protein
MRRALLLVSSICLLAGAPAQAQVGFSVPFGDSGSGGGLWIGGGGGPAKGAGEGKPGAPKPPLKTPQFKPETAKAPLKNDLAKTPLKTDLAKTPLKLDLGRTADKPELGKTNPKLDFRKANDKPVGDRKTLDKVGGPGRSTSLPAPAATRRQSISPKGRRASPQIAATTTRPNGITSRTAA